MLVVFLKSIIIFLVLLLVLRIMGKRQIGEMQPFEFVITLMIAEAATVPLNDPYLPLYYGLVPVITLGILHLLLSLIARKSIKARHLFSGKSVTAIDKSGLRFDNLKKMNMNTNDLLESVRAAGHPDFNRIEYALFETNGKLCVIEKQEDMFEKSKEPAMLPITLFVDGAWNKANLALCGVGKGIIENMFKNGGYKSPKQILYADIRQNGLVYISPKEGKYFTQKLDLPFDLHTKW